MTQLETLQATIAQERTSLDIHNEKLKASEYYRGVCQRALSDLEEAERFIHIGDLALGQLALQRAVEHVSKLMTPSRSVDTAFSPDSERVQPLRRNNSSQQRVSLEDATALFREHTSPLPAWRFKFVHVLHPCSACMALKNTGKAIWFCMMLCVFRKIY